MQCLDLPTERVLAVRAGKRESCLALHQRRWLRFPLSSGRVVLVGVHLTLVSKREAHGHCCLLRGRGKLRSAVSMCDKPFMRLADDADCGKFFAAGMLCHFIEDQLADLLARLDDLGHAQLAIRDTTPVTAMHTLVLPYRHAETYFDLTEQELAAANDLLRCLRSEILDADPLVRGFNVGTNVGVASGQTIFHCHIHLIPRRSGDVEEPLGEVPGSHPGENALLECGGARRPLDNRRGEGQPHDGDGVRLLTALGG